MVIEDIVKEILPMASVGTVVDQGYAHISIISTFKIKYDRNWLIDGPSQIRQACCEFATSTLPYRELENLRAKDKITLEGLQGYRDRYLSLRDVISDLNKCWEK